MSYGNRMPRPMPQIEPLIATEIAAAALIDEVETAIGDLETVIAEETRLVRTGALFEAGELEAEKSRAAAVYMRLRVKVQSNAVALGRFCADRVETLRARHEVFSALLRENLAVMAIAREVSEDLVRTVSEAVGKRAAPRTYGRDAGASLDRLGGARGIAVDRSL